MSTFEVQTSTVLKKPIPGYEDLYYATDSGEVWHKKKNRKLSASGGSVSLRKDMKNTGFRLERLIYTLFVDPAWDSIHKINHIDGDDSNCAASNLTCKSMIPDLPGEVWRSFEDKYEVSSVGRVRYVVKDILCNVKSFNENSMALVSVNSKTYRIDELVAIVFLGMEEGQCVYHKDGDIHNYKLDNLSLDPCIPTEEGEIWVDVKGYEGKYKVSSYGRIYSVPRKEKRSCTGHVTVVGKFLKPGEDEDGYYKVVLVDNTITKDMFVHRVVALNFIENPHPEIYDCINHLDGNKKNNSVDNLEWCTNQQNVNHAMDTGLRDYNAYNNYRAIPTIVVDSEGVKHRFESIQQAAIYLGVDPELLRLYVHGVHKRCKGLDTTRYTVYKTTKDDFDNAVLEPHIRLEYEGVSIL